MKKNVEIITIPSHSESSLLKIITTAMNYRGRRKGMVELHDSQHYKSDYFQPLQLLILSNHKDNMDINDIVFMIKENDWYPYNPDDNISDYKKVIASYPHIEGTLPIDKKTIQAWLDNGTPNEAIIEMKYKNTIGITPAGNPIKIDSFIEVPHLDSQDNLQLTFPMSAYDGTDFKTLPTPKQIDPPIPTDATNLEVFAIKPDENGKLFAYIGFKISNGNFEFITVPYTEPISQ